MGHFWGQRVGFMAAGVCAHVWVDQEAEKGLQLELRLTVTHEVHVQKSIFSTKVLPPEKILYPLKIFQSGGEYKVWGTYRNIIKP